MSNNKIFEELKDDFLKKNAAFVKAIKNTTDDTFNSTRNKIDLAVLRLETINSYQYLLNYRRKI